MNSDFSPSLKLAFPIILLLFLAASPAFLPSANAADAASVTILEINPHSPPGWERPDPAAVGSVWRYWETWQSETFLLDSGQTVHADIYRPIAVSKGADGKPIKDANGKSSIELRQPKQIQQSPLPPTGWQNPDFDDSTWYRHEGPMSEGYRGLSLVCLRGKFDVQDPAKTGDLSLSIGFRGGIVAYLNGKEVGRAFLPQGPLAPDALADPYPKDVYVSPDGNLINERSSMGADYTSYVVTADWAANFGYQFKNKEVLDRFQKRVRHAEIKIPASALRKGVNVLALEIHHAPANEIMYKAVASDKQLMLTLSATWAIQISFLGRVSPGIWWNHAGMEDLRLTAAPSASGFTPNDGRPKGMQVWNESVFKRILPTQYGDPNEPLRPVQIRALRNGTSSAQIIVGSPNAIKGLHVTVSDLAGSAGGTIPASNVEVDYARWASWPGQWQYDALDPEAPAELSPMAKPPWDPRTTMDKVAGVVQPVWFTVQVPKDAKVGTYTGKISIDAAGEKQIQTPIEVRIVSDWVVPDPHDFTTYVGILESPDSVAMQYNVPLWSDAHWKLMDKVMELLGQLGNREVYIPLITKTMLGNEQSMVRWIKQPDGSYKHDFSVAEKYLDLAVNHHWNISVTCLAVSDGNLGEALWYSGKPRNPPAVTVLDPATGKLSEMNAPAWGTPEARTFWKPVIEGMQDILKKRGLEKSMMFGFVVQNQVLPATIGDLKSIAPDVKWWEYTHWSKKRKGDAANFQDVGRMSWAFGAPLAVFWDPATDKPHYAWKHLAKDVFFVAAPRAKGQISVTELGELPIFRLFCESTLLGSHGGDDIIPEFGAFAGWGEVGADFWPISSKLNRTGNVDRLDDRYVGWGSLSLSDTLQNLLGAGKSAPTHSCRTQMLRESQQEAEARVFIQNALLDPSQTAKLGPALAAECKQLCDDRTRMLFYDTVYFGDAGVNYGHVFNQEQWDSQNEKFYQAADKVAKALGIPE